MDSDSKKILHLTLEILYLLTGEDYIVVKKNGGHVTPLRKSLLGSKPLPVISETSSEQKILELIQKITELLTGRGSFDAQNEVTCQRPLLSHGRMRFIVSFLYVWSSSYILSLIYKKRITTIPEIFTWNSVLVQL
ncbi:unnamed protein product [Staurois parvus]|uniref:Uncharacterized protein n=1 Tax=Staurois parvus TaxID=386267 RepID=A0ABN9APN5_9NEOB|nr:unnamed protein product [Staurois parvus]